MDTGCCLLAAVQVLGLAGAVIARAGENSSRHAVCFVLFLSSLFGVSATAMICLWLPCGMGTMSGFTIGLMLLATTCDFGPSAAGSSHHAGM